MKLAIKLKDGACGWDGESSRVEIGIDRVGCVWVRVG